MVFGASIGFSSMSSSRKALKADCCTRPRCPTIDVSVRFTRS